MGGENKAGPHYGEWGFGSRDGFEFQRGNMAMQLYGIAHEKNIHEEKIIINEFINAESVISINLISIQKCPISSQYT